MVKAKCPIRNFVLYHILGGLFFLKKSLIFLEKTALPKKKVWCVETRIVF